MASKFTFLFAFLVLAVPAMAQEPFIPKKHLEELEQKTENPALKKKVAALKETEKEASDCVLGDCFVVAVFNNEYESLYTHLAAVQMTFSSVRSLLKSAEKNSSKLH